MEDWKGFMSAKTIDDNIEDFEEEDMWNNQHYPSPSTTMNNDNPLLVSSASSFSSSSSSSAWKLSNKTTPKTIPRRAQTTSRNEPKAVQVQPQQSSAPMTIPDWSKIYGKTSINPSWACDDHHDGHDDDDDDDDDDRVPPHEWIARKLARSQISSFSVCEGIGRTLKGRDLSKVRNAILTKTGFLE